MLEGDGLVSSRRCRRGKGLTRVVTAQEWERKDRESYLVGEIQALYSQPTWSAQEVSHTCLE